MLSKRIYLLLNSLILVCLVFGEPLFTRRMNQALVVKAQSTNKVFLPIVTKPQAVTATRTVNLPYDVDGSQGAIFWFGRVAPGDSYAEVRTAYSSAGIFFRLNTFDSQVWYNSDTSTNALNTITQWDGFTLYLNINGGAARQPAAGSYKLVYQWNDDNLENHTAFYKGNGTTWNKVSLSIPAKYEYRGDSINSNGTPEDGWNIQLTLPYNQFGVTGTPVFGTRWSMAIDMADRDSAGGPANAVRVWPAANETAQIHFGVPTYTPAKTSSTTTIQIRQGVNGVTVKDGMVGGSSNCGDFLDKWTEWGEKNYFGSTFDVVQNQYDYADFPCFSKVYLEFPLSAIPAGKVIVSAKLVLHLSGNSYYDNYKEDGDDGAQESYIQLIRFKEDWNPQTVNWNNAPIPVENYAGTMVYPIPNDDEQGRFYEFDASRAVSDAYQAGSALKLVLYDGDFPMHSGKYFSSSFVDDGIVGRRPALEVVWGNP